MSMDLTQIIVALISTAGLVLVAFITNKVSPLIKSKITEAQYNQLMRFVDIAIKAAEQMKNNGEITNKFAYAEATVSELLAKHGLSYDASQVKSAIEAAVKDVFNSFEMVEYGEEL